MPKKTKIIAAFILLLHLIGAIGTIIPQTRALTISLTPANLVISSGLLLLGHQGPWKGLAAFFLLSFTLGFGVEVLGVHTGFPFGNYSYGDTLGWKIWNVPLVIGLNWFLLSYAFGKLYQNFPLLTYVQIFLAALSMVALDLLIEPVAIQLDYWQWENDIIPVENFIGWFLIALLMQVCFTFLRNTKTNHLVIPLIVSQIMYFTLIFIF